MAIDPSGIANRFETALRSSVRRLEAFMVELVAELDTDAGNVETTHTNLARATLMRQQLTRRLNELGFRSQVRTLYSDVATALERDAGDDEAQMLIAETVLSSFASGFTRNLDNSWFAMTGRIQEIVEQAMLTNAPIADLIAGLAGPGRGSIRLTADLQAPFAQWLNWSNAAVETALQSMVRSLQIVSATDAGVSWFIYQGTLIRTSRPFCRLMHGVVVRLEDLRAIDADPRFRQIRQLRSKDGRQPPLIPSLGGWRCRHRLVATSRKQAEREGRTIFADDGAELNRRAGALL